MQSGHRKSVDIDLFTDAVYGTVGFNIIEQYMVDNFTYVSTSFGINPAFGTSYQLGSDKQDAVKVDVYFFNSFLVNFVNDCVLASYMLVY